MKGSNHSSHNTVNFFHRRKDVLLTVTIAVLLGIPFIGLEIYENNYVLDVRSRWWMLGWIVLGVGVGRFFLRCFYDIWFVSFRNSKETKKFSDYKSDKRIEKIIKFLGYALFIVAVFLPFMPFVGRSLLDLATTILVYVMLGLGLNVVVGLAGLLDLGYVAFYAVGAYSYALLSTNFGWSYWICLLLAGLLSGSFGVLLGFPVLRLRGDYLAIVTLGFGEIIRIVLQNWQSLTGAAAGIASIPRPTFFGLPFAAPGVSESTTFAEFFGIEYSPVQRVVFLYYLILVLALLTNLFVQRMRNLPIGRAWEALREDEIACKSLGINTTNVKLSAFGIGAMLAGIAGSFYAAKFAFVSPDSFTFIESAIILSIVVLGGMGNQLGVILAAMVLIGLPEMFRELQDFRMLTFGGAMIVIMVWRPQGLLAHRIPSLRLGSPALSEKS